MKAKLIELKAGDGLDTGLIRFLFEAPFKEAATLGEITGNEVFSIDVGDEPKTRWRKSETGGLVPYSIVRAVDADGYTLYRLDIQANKGDYYFPINEIKEDEK